MAYGIVGLSPIDYKSTKTLSSEILNIVNIINVTHSKQTTLTNNFHACDSQIA